jgi:response regulator RpfG family c-di-GMP phosphodiesterase
MVRTALVGRGWSPNEPLHQALSQETQLLRIASPLHDIGKIGISDDILRKPGKLTPDEWEEMRKHPAIGSARSSGVLLIR